MIRLLAALLIFASASAFGKPVAVAQVDGKSITLTDEPCAVKEVANLPYRGTWAQDGKTFEGCWGMRNGIVVSYWREDRTVAVIPAQWFQAVKEI